MDYWLENNIIKTTDFSFNDDLGGLGTVFFNYMKLHSKRIAQIQAETNISDTYESLLKKCVRTAIALRERGVKKGDFICLCSELELDSCVPIIAAAFLGCVFYSLDKTVAVSDQLEIFESFPPKIIFISQNAKDHIKAVLSEGNLAIDYVTFEVDFDEQFLCEKPEEDSFTPEYIKDSNELYCIFFTSGSTGRPKAILLNHYYFLSTCMPLTNTWTRGFFYCEGIKDPVILFYPTWQWVTSLLKLAQLVTLGVCRVLSKKFDEKEVWNILKKYKVTNVFLTPYQCIELYFNRPEKINLPYLVELVHGGSKLDKEYVIRLAQILSPVWVKCEYGMSENGILITFDPSREERRKLMWKCPDGIGGPISGLEYKVVDLETEEALGPNQLGELRVNAWDKRSYMNGYYQQDSSNCFDKDGWFKTEDIVYYDENFCFYLVDRLKERVVYKDWFVYPSLVEKILLEHPLIKNAVVIAVPHKEDGERIRAVVLLKEEVKNFNGLAKEIEEFVNARVEESHEITDGVEFLDEFPLTSTGKIDKKTIRHIVLKT